MKNLCIQNSFILTFTAAFVLFVFIFAGCGSIKTLADNFGSEAEPAATPNAQTTARCQAILRGGSRNRANDRGELPADFPVPRGTVLCGFDGDMRTTYYLNDALGGEEVAQFYRETLPPQDFQLLRDNAKTGGGRFMNFVRGTDETIQVETKPSADASYRNVFSAAYVPPITNGNWTPLPIMRHGNAGNNAKTQTTTITQNGNSQNAPACGSNPLGSLKCAIELQKSLRNWQFALEDTATNGRRKTYAGEFAKRDHQVRVRAVITGRGRDDGEWWFRLGDNPLLGAAGDNGSRAYRKEGGAWVRYQATPDDVGGILITDTAPIGEIDGENMPLVGTENINGEECNHFRRVIPRQSDYYPEVIIDYWISKRTGYCLRRRSESGGSIRLLNVSRHGEINNMDSPAAEN